jgi:sterol desaturase/sphingolipid hydroxylase (fatty acid hydroxylase superfamily)
MRYHHLVHALINFLPSPLVPLLILFVVQLAVLTWLEQRHGIYRVRLSAVFTGDLITTLWVFFFVVPLCDRYSGWMRATALAPAQWATVVPAHWSALPLAVRVLTYIVLADFGHYAIHRLEHAPIFWRIHRWHHSADHMGFLACTRVSLVDRMFTIFSYVFFAPLVVPAPGWVWTGLVVFALFKNDWMHLNVSWGSRRVEWVFVTPRYHHIHHSEDKAHHDRNFGIFFSFWDRLFGTYVDPEGLTGRLKFGIGEQIPAARLVVGL